MDVYGVVFEGLLRPLIDPDNKLGHGEEANLVHYRLDAALIRSRPVVQLPKNEALRLAVRSYIALDRKSVV